jgi:hypothetical protein
MNELNILKPPDKKKRARIDGLASRVTYLIEDEVNSGGLTELECIQVIRTIMEEIVKQKTGLITIIDREDLE